MKISENILISSLTTMRLGGPARYVIEVEAKEDVIDAFYFAKQQNLPIFILGYGANTIGHDEGFNGVIIINRMRGITELQEQQEGNTQQDSFYIKAMGGEYWDNVVAFACERDLTGIEGLSKIPGLTGAAPVQNIGAYGQQISNVLTEIEVFDSVTETFKVMSNADLQFSYRKSILNSTEKGRYFVISITLKLQKGQMPGPYYTSIERFITEHNITDLGPQGIRAIVSQIRADKLPDPVEKPSSGSFFKNIYLDNEEADIAENKGYPVYRGKDGNKINSGWLIEQAGFKGKLIHGFRVNEKATLVLINESATSYEDLKKARTEIINKVYDKFGYWLEQEPEEIL